MTSKRKSKASKDSVDMTVIRASVAAVKAKKGTVNMCPFKSGSAECEAWLKEFESPTKSEDVGTVVADNSDSQPSD